MGYSLGYVARFELAVCGVIVPKGIFVIVLNVKVLVDLAVFVDHSL
jgi:hypothetical protein